MARIGTRYGDICRDSRDRQELSAYLRRLERQIRELRSQIGRAADYSCYRDDPAGYARDVLKVRLSPRQDEIAPSLLEPPYRTLVPSGHDVGKTFAGAVLLSWWYDTRNPSVCLTTAPKLEQVKDLLWKEIRSQRRRVGLGGFAGPKSLRLESGPKHFAKGITANQQAGFQGQHERNVLIIIDEAEGVDRDYFEAAKTMASGEGHAIVCFYNPYSSTSHVAQEESAVDANGKPSWRMLPMSSLDHPNIAAELRGEPPPFPQAVRLAKVEQWVGDWCTPIQPADAKVTDIEWRPGSGHWWRPGPRFEAGALGRRPTQAVDSVWSLALVEACVRRELPARGRVQIGCDVARFGDDDTAIHVQQGGVSVHHEAVNGWDTVRIAGRLKQLACEWSAAAGVDGRQVPIAVDDCGVGGGVTDILAADRWNVSGVNVAVASPDEERYPDLRSALWCDLADEASKGNVSFARLSRDVQQHLRRELPSQQYKMDARGRRCCLSKDKVKQMLGRSPDNADAVILAYCNVLAIADRVAGRVEVPS